MEPTTIETALGPIPIWSHPGALVSAKPVILAITGAWAGADDMTALQGVVGPAWDACVMRLPGNGVPDLAETSIAAWARAAGEAIDRTFAGRTVVLLGVSIGALVALGVRSPQVRRVLALEPPLVMDKLWPMIDAMRARLVQAPRDRPLIENIFGVTEAGLLGRTYFDLFEDLPTPVEVVVGDQPLEPRRAVERYPSFVDQPERAWLARQSGVTLHVAPGAGHNIHVFAQHFLRDVVRAALAKVLEEVAGEERSEIPLRLEVVVFAPLLMDIRTRLPAQALAREPDLRVGLSKPPFVLPAAARDEPKILVLQRPSLAGADAWREPMADAIAAGWVVVLEFDDHPRLIAELMGDPNAPPDWDRFGYQHAIQVSTPALKTFFEAYNPEVAVFPNAVFELSPFPKARHGASVFFGGAMRGLLAVEVARALGPAIAAHPETEFVVVSDRAFFEALPTDRKTFHDYLPYEAYLALMRRCAISLSPLEDRPLTETKSDAKFLDASSVGALTIASPTVYAATIEDGVNGLIARELGDWPRLLARALAEPAWREQLARRAWDYVRAERMFAYQVPIRKAWYRDLWARREALNRALYDRLPGLEAAVQARRD